MLMCVHEEEGCGLDEVTQLPYPSSPSDMVDLERDEGHFNVTTQRDQKDLEGI